MQSLKLCQKANSSPPWGLALNLPGLLVFRGTEEEAISDKVWGVGGCSLSPRPTLRRVGVSLLVSMPLCSSVSCFAFVCINPSPVLIRVSSTAGAEPQRACWTTV